MAAADQENRATHGVDKITETPPNIVLSHAINKTLVRGLVVRCLLCKVSCLHEALVSDGIVLDYFILLGFPDSIGIV